MATPPFPPAYPTAAEPQIGAAASRLAPEPAQPPNPEAMRATRITSDRLFAGAAEVQIDHRGAVYRLRQTALGKLILTK